MNNKIFIRIIIDIVIGITIIYGWWPLALVVVLIGIWMYDYFFEAIIAGLAYDSLFGLVPETGSIGYLGIISSVVLFTVMIALKKTLRR
jgi:hypothetical protein